MATRLTGGTLTVTITEALTVTHSTSADNRSHAQTITKTFASIDNIDVRVLNLPNTNQVKVVDLVDEHLNVMVNNQAEYLTYNNQIFNFLVINRLIRRSQDGQ